MLSASSICAMEKRPAVQDGWMKAWPHNCRCTTRNGVEMVSPLVKTENKRLVNCPLVLGMGGQLACIISVGTQWESVRNLCRERKAWVLAIQTSLRLTTVYGRGRSQSEIGWPAGSWKTQSAMESAKAKEMVHRRSFRHSSEAGAHQPLPPRLVPNQRRRSIVCWFLSWYWFFSSAAMEAPRVISSADRCK